MTSFLTLNLTAKIPKGTYAAMAPNERGVGKIGTF